MDHQFCPGSKLLRQPKPEEMVCLGCGAEVEIWSDEVRATCRNCGKTLMRDETMSCLEWCKMGKECVGEEVYGRYLKNKSATVKQRLLSDLEIWFGDDQRRIDHARQVLSFAEQLLEREKADPHIVIPAAILHDVGIKAAEEKYQSSAGRYQEIEGPPIARKILRKAGFQEQATDEICEIIGNHHSPGKVNTVNFKVLYDADCLVNLAGSLEKKESKEAEETIERVFLTEGGKELAKGRLHESNHR